ncbi:hypothetical protein BC835DRAFT_1421150 [Cytidiella melzeri]|nr:hypothetical protein BC835DRAFT_1421150 [Cytidiella melzeri]
MAKPTDTTLAPLNASRDVMSQLQGLSLKEDAKHNLARVGAFIDVPATVKDKGTIFSDEPGTTPPDCIPGMWTLGATYVVLGGKYADPTSIIQQVMDWGKCNFRQQEYGGKTYSVPLVVNFSRNTGSDYYSCSGTSATEYIEELSFHAGFKVGFPGFSSSASVDFSKSEMQSLSNAFTRVTHEVTHYSLSLSPPSEIIPLLRPSFVDALDNMDPSELYDTYGTHILSSILMGGRALFLTATDTRSYSSEISFSASAQISASYKLAVGTLELSAKARAAMNSFNDSSEFSITTRGGDPRYGNLDFLRNVEDWAASVIEYPEFIEFGPSPCLRGLWEFASTPDRRNLLKQAYETCVTNFNPHLGIAGPYLKARKTFDTTGAASVIVASSGSWIYYEYPYRRDTSPFDGWYLISLGLTGTIGLSETFPVILAQELVPGALAQVTWEVILTVPAKAEKRHTQFWRAIPPTSDYVAMGVFAFTDLTGNQKSQPPEELVRYFRAVHKSALAASSVTLEYSFRDNKYFCVGNTHWFAGKRLPREKDLFTLHSPMVIWEDDVEETRAEVTRKEVLLDQALQDPGSASKKVESVSESLQNELKLL